MQEIKERNGVFIDFIFKYQKPIDYKSKPKSSVLLMCVGHFKRLRYLNLNVPVYNLEYLEK